MPVRFWYHFAFKIISIALFGIGLGSLLVFFVNRLVKNYAGFVLTIFIFLLGISFPITLIKLNQIPLEMDLVGKVLIQTHYYTNFFFILTIPFVLAGFIFSFLFTNFNKDISKIYFFDLLGGGIGCLFALMIFPHHGPFISGFVISILVFAVSGIFLFKSIKWFSFLLPIAFITMSIVYVYPVMKNTNVTISRRKKYSYPLKTKLFSDWDNFGYVAVLKKEKEKRYIVATAIIHLTLTCLILHDAAMLKAYKDYDITRDHITHLSLINMLKMLVLLVSALVRTF